VENAALDQVVMAGLELEAFRLNHEGALTDSIYAACPVIGVIIMFSEYLANTSVSLQVALVGDSLSK
jgi:3-dehydroquinate dehydratase